MIINAELHIMDDNHTVISNGYISYANGKIIETGEMSALHTIPDDAIDAKGNPVYPGLIDAHTHLGIFGDSLTFEGDDGNEDTDPSTPHLRVIDAVNPLDGYFSEAIQAGITTVLTSPGSANPVAGQIACIKTFGRRIDNMIVKAPAAIKFALGENPKSTYNDKEQTPVTRMATAAIIRETLFRAKKYYDDTQKSLSDPQSFDPPEYDMRSDALMPLMKKEIPAHFHVHRADDIFTAIRIAKEFDIDYVLVHATEAHLVIDELDSKRFAGILSGPILTDRSKPELHHQSPQAPAILSQNGIPTAIITDHPETPIQYLTLCAAVAVREGMSPDEAMRAITVNPARICGIADRTGTLEPGKDADMVIFHESPLNIFQKPLAVIAEGRTVFCRL